MPYGNKPEKFVSQKILFKRQLELEIKSGSKSAISKLEFINDKVQKSRQFHNCGDTKIIGKQGKEKVGGRN